MGVERILRNEEKLGDVLARWGPYRDQVRFYLRKYRLKQGPGAYSFCQFT